MVCPKTTEEGGMKIFVGLGNPGTKYAANRHNIGFMALDAIAAAHGFAPWRTKFQAEIAEGRLGAEKVVLIKPQTFMNLSGQSVVEALRFFKLEPADLVVFHDELDLAPGKLRCKQGGGHAGHNGLRSIHGHIGPDYARVRLGIGHPGHKDRVSPYVLSDFAKADQGWLDDMMRGIADGAVALAQGDTAKFSNKVALCMGAGPKAEAPAPSSAPAPSTATPAASAAPPDTRSALQKLVDRFR